MDDPLKTLSQLAFEKQRMKCPNIPTYAIPVIRYSDKTTAGLTKCIIDYINLNAGMAERINNTGRYLQGQSVTDVIGIVRHLKGKYIPGTGTNGTSDIKAIFKGISLSIEVKCKETNDRQREEQKVYQQKIEAAGGLYFIATDFKSFYNWINQLIKKEVNL